MLLQPLVAETAVVFPQSVATSAPSVAVAKPSLPSSVDTATTPSKRRCERSKFSLP